MSNHFETVTLGAGCFWCVEAVFQSLSGVRRVVSGYAGGTVENPTYEEVCTGTTGHAEAVQVTFDRDLIPFEELLAVFWRSHDPTTLNRQGADCGTQYRSVIFYHTDNQREIAERSKQETDESGLWSNPIVTEITPFTNFYEAEGYHQEFYRRNPWQPYCRAVIEPKLKKVAQKFSDKIKDEAG